MSEFDPAELRSALASYMTGVTVVTAVTPSGEPVGFTANSFTSVSLNPPLLLVCPGKHLSSFDVFAETTCFAVNVLAEGQEAISNIFASSKAERFEQIAWHKDDAGCPLIVGAAAQFSCSLHQSVEAGDHVILIGRITQFQHADKLGLGYCRDGYFSLNQERRSEAVAATDTRIISAVLLEQDGQLCLLRGSDGLHLPGVEAPDRSGARSAITQHLASLEIDAELGPVYSVFDDTEHGEHVTVFRARLLQAAATNGLEHVSISDPSLTSLPSPANPEMMRRYQLEYRNNQFGLYIGDAVRGEVHHAEPPTATTI
jgi:flavin reductase (DIM6/NTAB) family NADH-FMN oxidoreductase RutF